MLIQRTSRIFPVTHLLLFCILLAALFVAAQAMPVYFGAFHYLSVGVFVSVGLLFLTYFWVKREGTTLETLGLRWREHIMSHSFIGLFAGLSVMAIIYVVVWHSTDAEIKVLPETVLFSFLLKAVPTLLALALMEELAFRGYLLFKLRQLLNTRVAIYATAIVFGLYHGLVIESLIGPAVWGLVFALLAFWSRGLAMPTMFHFALNFAQAIFDSKPKYTPGLYEFVISDEATANLVYQVGLAIQGGILVIAIVLIEVYCRKENGLSR
ncbi:CPBP family intramembrane glutamic endopeptidase [Kangiella sp.]|uniref:CPBP family intramembrane glutamic endopeptidase n=1 Tax=Kangiella sp. TaxID=1920245 RepID=UPI003A906F6A